MAAASKGLTEIPVMVDSVQKWVTGLTPKTTCDDIIHSLLISMNHPLAHEAVAKYALFENINGVERPLSGRTKLAKMWKDYKEIDVVLTLRKAENRIVQLNTCSSVSKKKQKTKPWFKFLNRSKSSKVLSNAIAASDTRHMLKDSSILMQDKENNLLSAFNCCSSKKRKPNGLTERLRNSTFERPRNVFVHSQKVDATSCNTSVKYKHAPVSEISSIYSKEQYVSSEHSNQYASLDTVKSLVEHSSSSHKRSSSSVNIYGSTISLNTRETGGIAACKSRNNASGTYTSLKSNAERSDEQLNSMHMVQESVEHYYDYPDHKWNGNHQHITQQPAYGYSNHINTESDSKRDGHFKKLLNLVISNEHQVQQQFHKIKEADQRIETYETKLHTVRSQSQGTHYLEDNYLSNSKSTKQNHQIEEYKSIIENMKVVDNRLLEQYEKLESLSGLLHVETQSMDETFCVSGPLESTRVIDPAIQKQIDELRSQLQQTIKTSIDRDQEIKELDKHFVAFKHELKEKENILSKLSTELERDNVKSNNIVDDEKISSPDNHEKLCSELRQTENAIRAILSSVPNVQQDQPCDLDSAVSDMSKHSSVMLESDYCESEYATSVVDISSLCNATDDVKMQFSPGFNTYLPPIGAETMAKAFSTKLMPDLVYPEPQKNITMNLNNTTVIGTPKIDETSLWHTEDHGIDVTFNLPEEDNLENTYCISLSKSSTTLLDSTMVNKSNTFLESMNNVNFESPSFISSHDYPTRPIASLQSQKSSVKKKLFCDYSHGVVEREIKGIMASLTGDMSTTILSDSSGESGVGSFQSDYSVADISGDNGWARVETCV